jgi:hypothetical protein
MPFTEEQRKAYQKKLMATTGTIRIEKSTLNELRKTKVVKINGLVNDSDRILELVRQSKELKELKKTLGN